MKSKRQNIGALWARRSQSGREYLSGQIEGRAVVVFRNTFKRQAKHPDYVVLPAESRRPASRSRTRATHFNDGTPVPWDMRHLVAEDECGDETTIQ